VRGAEALIRVGNILGIVTVYSLKLVTDRPTDEKIFELIEVEIKEMLKGLDDIPFHLKAYEAIIENVLAIMCNDGVGLNKDVTSLIDKMSQNFSADDQVSFQELQAKNLNLLNKAKIIHKWLGNLLKDDDTELFLLEEQQEGETLRPERAIVEKQRKRKVEIVDIGFDPLLRKCSTIIAGQTHVLGDIVNLNDQVMIRLAYTRNNLYMWGSHLQLLQLIGTFGIFATSILGMNLDQWVFAAPKKGTFEYCTLGIVAVMVLIEVCVGSYLYCVRKSEVIVKEQQAVTSCVTSCRTKFQQVAETGTNWSCWFCWNVTETMNAVGPLTKMNQETRERNDTLMVADIFLYRVISESSSPNKILGNRGELSPKAFYDFVSRTLLGHDFENSDTGLRPRDMRCINKKPTWKTRPAVIVRRDVAILSIFPLRVVVTRSYLVIAALASSRGTESSNADLDSYLKVLEDDLSKSKDSSKSFLLKAYDVVLRFAYEIVKHEVCRCDEKLMEILEEIELKEVKKLSDSKIGQLKNSAISKTIIEVNELKDQVTHWISQTDSVVQWLNGLVEEDEDSINELVKMSMLNQPLDPTSKAQRVALEEMMDVLEPTARHYTSLGTRLRNMYGVLSHSSERLFFIVILHCFSILA
jgi:hypothetical protein